MGKDSRDKAGEAYRKLRYSETEADNAKKIFEKIGDSDGAGLAKKASDAAKEGADYVQRRLGKG